MTTTSTSGAEPLPPTRPGRPSAGPGDASDLSWRWRLLLVVVWFVLRATLWLSPRPTVALIRWTFTRGGRAAAAALARHDPGGVDGVTGECYDASRAGLLDIWWPADLEGTDRRLPTLVWIHGGGWIAGSRTNLAGYLRTLAARGFTVVGVDYTLAPRARYPNPLRQIMTALRHLSEHADRLHCDPQRLMLAGDSAGAHIAAQVALTVTNPAYAEAVGVAPTIAPAQLRAAALCCGPYDLELISRLGRVGPFADAILRTYAGRRDLSREPVAGTASVNRHVTGAFPPTFLTAGNADPIAAHSTLMSEALTARGVEVETLFYAADHQPPLPHEYQFDLDRPESRQALDRLTSFLRRRGDGDHRSG